MYDDGRFNASRFSRLIPDGFQKIFFGKFQKCRQKPPPSVVLCIYGRSKRKERGESIERREFEKAVSLQFEVYCKRTLLRELADIAKEAKRRKRRKQDNDETPMSSLDKADARKLERLSHAQEATLFYVAGYEIPIRSDRLADGLLRLTERQRQMVLLSEYCGEPDAKIGERMGVKRSTVRSQRKKALSELRERLER